MIDVTGAEIAAGYAGRDRDPRAAFHRPLGAMSEATAQALHQGWYRTGDVGRRDADGYSSCTTAKH